MEIKDMIRQESRISTLEGKINVLIGLNAVNFFAVVGLILTVLNMVK